MNYVNFTLDENGCETMIDCRESTYDIGFIRCLIMKLILDNKILLGTSTEGSIDFNKDTFSVNHKVCRPIGGFDSWDEMFTSNNNIDYGI